MDLSKILSINGKPGLYQVVSQSRTGLIVESLEDGKKIPISATHRVSALGDISMYTLSDDVPLSEIFKKIFEFTEGKEGPSPKSSEDDMRAFMDQAFPTYDEDRVYVSDLRKLFKWYNLLLEKGLMTFEDEEENTESDPQSDGEEEKETDQ